MNPWQAMVREFHLISGQRAPERVDFAGLPFAMRIRLLEEEAREAVDALRTLEIFGGEENEAHILAELSDLIYVAVGASVSVGVDLNPYVEAIHAANMSKCDGTLGPRQVRADGKILKPPGWRKADLLPLLRKSKELKP